MLPLARREDRLEHGCISFGQSYDTVFWIASELAGSPGDERVAVYAGTGRCGIFRGVAFARIEGEAIKEEIAVTSQ